MGCCVPYMFYSIEMYALSTWLRNVRVRSLRRNTRMRSQFAGGVRTAYCWAAKCISSTLECGVQTRSSCNITNKNTCQLSFSEVCKWTWILYILVGWVHTAHNTFDPYAMAIDEIVAGDSMWGNGPNQPPSAQFQHCMLEEIVQHLSHQQHNRNCFYVLFVVFFSIPDRNVWKKQTHVIDMAGNEFFISLSFAISLPIFNLSQYCVTRDDISLDIWNCNNDFLLFFNFQHNNILIYNMLVISTIIYWR